MADNSQIAQYPYMFDPSQMSNKYSPYAGVAIPWGSYNGGSTGPTDAHGKPIQSYQDTQAAHAAWAAANPAAQAPVQAPVQAPLGTRLDSNGNANAPGSSLNPAGDWTSLAPQLPGASPQEQANYAYNLGLGGFTDPSTKQAYVGGGQGTGAGNSVNGVGNTGATASAATASGDPNFALENQWLTSQGRPPQVAPAATAAPAAPSNPYDMNAAYLAALSNPGHVSTPGATVAQSAAPSNQSGVLQQFLANWGGNSKGAGNYDNSGFINSLRGMV